MKRSKKSIQFLATYCQVTNNILSLICFLINNAKVWQLTKYFSYTFRQRGVGCGRFRVVARNLQPTGETEVMDTPGTSPRESSSNLQCHRIPIFALALFLLFSFFSSLKTTCVVVLLQHNGVF